MSEEAGKRDESFVPADAAPTTAAALAADASITSSFGCDLCCRVLQVGETRFHCETCGNWDACAACIDSKGHEHDVWPERVRTSRHIEHLAAAARGNVRRTLRLCLALHRHRPLLGSRQRLEDGSLGDYQWMTSGELLTAAERMARGLRAAGVPAGSFVGVCGLQTPHWYVSDAGSGLAGCIVVPVHTTLDVDSMRHVVLQARLNVIFADAELLPLVAEAAAGSDDLRLLVRMSSRAPAHGPASDDVLARCAAGAEACGVRLLTTDDLLASGAELYSPPDYDDGHWTDVTDELDDAGEVKAGDLASVIYTSGSTGAPKGVMFSHAAASRQMQLDLQLRQYVVHVSFGPLAHSQRGHDWRALCGGSRVSLYSGDMSHLFDDIKLARPTIISAVPRVYDILYNRFQSKLAELRREAAAQAEQLAATGSLSPVAAAADGGGAAAAGAAGDGAAEGKEDEVASVIKIKPLMGETEASMWKRLKDQLQQEGARRQAELWRLSDADLVDFARAHVADMLGDRLMMLITGGAATSPEVLAFMKKTWSSAMIYNGYASMEAGSLGSDGQFSNVSVRLRAWEDYTPEDKPFPRGELMVKSLTMCLGYLNNEEATASAFDDDGFFATGDLVELMDGARYRLLGRKKAVLKLAQGEWLSPDRVEGVLLRSELVTQLAVYARGEWVCPVAVVVPSFDELRKAVGAGDDVSDADLCSLPEAVAAVQQDLLTQAHASRLAPYETPAALMLVAQPFTPDNGLLTPSRKPNRRAVERAFEEHWDTLYAAARGGRPAAAAAVAPAPDGGKPSLASLLAAALGRDAVDGSTSFLHHGGDSLQALEAVAKVEQKLGVAVPVGMLMDESASIDAIAAAVEHGSHGVLPSSRRSGLPFDIEKETTLPADICASADGDGSRRGQDVLLTGGTGFIGAALLVKLLQSTPADVSIYCLVRCTSMLHGRRRLTEAVGTVLVDMPAADRDALICKRVVVVPGDLSERRLGMRRLMWDTMARDVGIIIHNGAKVSSVAPYAVLRATNVGSTLELLRLACDGATKALHFLSTASVLTAAYSEEDTLETVAAGLRVMGGYGQTKWVAESLLRTAGELRGIPSVVWRPCTVTADSRRGYAALDDYFSRLLSTIVQLQAAPALEEDAQFNLIPVDFVCDAIVGAVLSDGPLARGPATLHLIPHAAPTSMRTVVAAAVAQGYDVHFVPLSAWVLMLEDACRAAESGDDFAAPPPALAPLLPTFTVTLPDGSKQAVFSAARCHKSAITAAALSEHLALPWKHVSIDELRLQFDFLAASGELRGAVKRA
eukprot:PLAT10717.1.p1 GENE.PLAT10717.1~~PLAT10717.1.p1  ORF type:complete len:1306 (-),score=627.25 PLAT10717.1:58-3942(-)